MLVQQPHYEPQNLLWKPVSNDEIHIIFSGDGCYQSLAQVTDISQSTCTSLHETASPHAHARSTLFVIMKALEWLSSGQRSNLHKQVRILWSTITRVSFTICIPHRYVVIQQIASRNPYRCIWKQILIWLVLPLWQCKAPGATIAQKAVAPRPLQPAMDNHCAIVRPTRCNGSDQRGRRVIATKFERRFCRTICSRVALLTRII